MFSRARDVTGSWPLQDVVCSFGDCALVKTIIGMQHLLYCTPPPVVFCNQYCAIYGIPPTLLFCHSTYNIGIGNIV